MKTTTNFMNPQAITSVYGALPTFAGAELVDVHFRRDEPRLTVRLMMFEKPCTPPRRWPENYDVIYLEMSFIDVQMLSFSGLEYENRLVGFKLESAGEMASVEYICDGGRSLTFHCRWIRVESLTFGYLSTE